MRLFIALKIQESLLNDVFDFFSQLRNADKYVKWVDKENLHITLKFLGETDKDKLPDIIASLENVVSKIDFSYINLLIKNLCAFPNIDNPRVLWVGIDNEINKVNRLQKMIENELYKLGFAKENRPFQPHLTVARVKDKKVNKKITEFFVVNKDKSFGQFQVNSLYLVESKLLPAGAQYTDIKSFAFPL